MFRELFSKSYAGQNRNTGALPGVAIKLVDALPVLTQRINSDDSDPVTAEVQQPISPAPGFEKMITEELGARKPACGPAAGNRKQAGITVL